MDHISIQAFADEFAKIAAEDPILEFFEDGVRKFEPKKFEIQKFEPAKAGTSAPKSKAVPKGKIPWKTLGKAGLGTAATYGAYKLLSGKKKTANALTSGLQLARPAAAGRRIMSSGNAAADFARLKAKKTSGQMLSPGAAALRTQQPKKGLLSRVFG